MPYSKQIRVIEGLWSVIYQQVIEANRKDNAQCTAAMVGLDLLELTCKHRYAFTKVKDRLVQHGVIRKRRQIYQDAAADPSGYRHDKATKFHQVLPQLSEIRRKSGDKPNPLSYE